MDAIAALDLVRSPEGWLQASGNDGRFASLFGRDALIAALQVLPIDVEIAHATLARLGQELGATDDAETEQEPGKVLHEARDGDLANYVAHGWPVRDGRLRYWGSVDASPWFLVLFGALVRGGHDVRPHEPAARRVAERLAALEMPVAYVRRARRGGLAHHGWRDVAADLEGEGHGVVGERGTPLRPPVALAQVQALVWRALAEVAAVLDDRYHVAAARARAAFFDTFVGASHELPAFARHAGGIDRSITSDLGQVLWSGVLDDTPAVETAARARLSAPDLATPYGIRSLSTAHVAFREDGYHTGAVWPFDTWLGAPAHWPGVVEACRALGGFPELYVVGVDGTLSAHPESCPVQAWTVGAVLAIGAGWDGRAWAF
jgi:glycogen debranching enzyme